MTFRMAVTAYSILRLSAWETHTVEPATRQLKHQEGLPFSHFIKEA